MAGGTASVVHSAVEYQSNVVASSVPRDSRVTTCANTVDPSLMLSQHSEALLRGLNALRCADKLFDVTLIVEEKTFKAHRVVLAACSDYFCAMFTDAMRESRQSEIKLNGVNANGIELLLEYAYTAKLELNRNNVQDVLAVSTHVQMKAVIDACSNYLESQIDLENCVAIAVLADLYALDALKRKTYRYICSRLDEFSRSTDLLNITWDQLEYILSCNYPVDCSEERVLLITLHYCVESNLKSDLASLLFAKLRYQQINSGNLESLLSALETKDERASIYVKLIRNEILKNDKKEQQQQQQQQQLQKIESTTNNNSGAQTKSETEEIVATDVLVNSRGMELALVKIGGFETSGLTNQISCYLPTVGKWESLTVIPHIEQCNYGSAVLGNELYIVGGSYDVCLREYIHPFGFRYCPTKDKWKTIAPIQADRCRFSLNAMGTDYLYAVGGVRELNDVEDGSDHWGNDMDIWNCERYNASVNIWEYMPPLAENRSQHAGVVLGDKLYISGGLYCHIVLSSLWCFDTQVEKWNKLQPMLTPRADHILIAMDSKIYACGGWYEDPLLGTRVLVGTIDVYDAANDSWSVETTNPMPKYYTGVAAIKRRIYFIGGLLSSPTINRATTAVQCYDLDTKEWSFNVEWEYPKEVWECTLAAFYVPKVRDDFKYYWSEA